MVFFVLLRRGVRAGLLERAGFYPRSVRESLRGSRPIWIHAASVGEVLSVIRLTEQLKEKFPGRKLLLSTFTPTGRKIARQVSRCVDGIIFFPIDHPWAVRRALRFFEPCLLIFLETEIWPNFLRSAYRHGIPTLLLSGRLSPRAFRRYRFLRGFFSSVISQFNCLGMQNEESAERMMRLGVDPVKVRITGNLKHAPKEGRDLEQGGGLTSLGSGAEGARPVLIAGSTHRGEEEILLDVFLFLKTRYPELQMVLAPRHPKRFHEVERLMQRRNVNYEKRSLMDGGKLRRPDVLFLDTLGDLPAVYGFGDIAFVGGSLVDAGGHNPMEPARWRKPILFGPHMTNFADIAEEMKRRGGGIEVQGKADLIREISGLLADRERAQRIGEQAWEVVQRDRGVLDRSMGVICRYMDEG